MKTKALAVLLALSLVLTPLAQALPQKVLYQGTLRRAGQIFTGNATFLFRVTDASGATEYWTSGSTVVAVSAGLFRYPLGEDNAGGTGLNGKPFQNVPWALIEPYVETTVDGAILAPREPMVSVPYALYLATGSQFSVGASTFVVTGGRVGIGTSSPSTSLDLQGGHMTIGPVGGNSYNIRFSTRGLIMFNNAFANLGTGVNVGGMGFLDAGQSHGQFHYRARKGFELLDVSADAPAIDHLSAAFAPIHAGALIVGGLDESRYNLYSGPADGIQITDGSFIVGTSTLVVTSGKVGIGTSSPLDKLHIAHNSGQSIIGGWGCGASFTGLGFSTTLTGCGNYSLLGEGSHTYINRPSAGTLFFRENNSTQMVIMPTSGNVGIGTTVPAALLDVNGSAQFGSGVDKSTFTSAGSLKLAAAARLGVYDGAANYGELFTGSSGGLVATHLGSRTGVPLAFYTNSSGPQMTLTTAGNVGVGTTNPQSAFDVAGGSMTFGSLASSSTIRQDLATDDLIIAINRQAADSDIIFRTQGAGASNTRMVLTGGGNVGVGTTSPQSVLHVPDGKYAQFEDNNAGAPAAGDCDSDTERGRLSIDTTNNRLYICNGASRGWDYAALTD